MTSPYEPLIEVQLLDTELDQLGHRRENLPDRVVYGEKTQELSGVRDRVSVVQAEIDGFSKSERRLEDEASTVESKVHELERKMQSTTSPKDLMAMQHEVDLLSGRQRKLEDEAIELMEEMESRAATLADLTTRASEVEGELAQLEQSISDQEASIDSELAEVTSRRDGFRSVLPESLLQRYDQVRPRMDGVAVARLDGDRCTGCHLSLSAVEIDALRHAPEEAEVTCPECGRILVR